MILNLIINNFPALLSFVMVLYFIVFNKKSLAYWFLGFFIFFLFSLIYILTLVYLQYSIWASHPISKYLLPPYRSIFYFVSYTYHHIYKNFLWSLIGAVFVFLILVFTNKIFKNSLYYEDELIKVPILASLMVFPFNFMFFISGLGTIFLLHVISMVKNKNKIFEKISIRDYWVFLALFFIILLNVVNLKNRIFLNFMP